MFIHSLGTVVDHQWQTFTLLSFMENFTSVLLFYVIFCIKIAFLVIAASILLTNLYLRMDKDWWLKKHSQYWQIMAKLLAKMCIVHSGLNDSLCPNLPWLLPKTYWGHFIQSDKQLKKLHSLRAASVSASDGAAT